MLKDLLKRVVSKYSNTVTRFEIDKPTSNQIIKSNNLFTISGWAHSLTDDVIKVEARLNSDEDWQELKYGIDRVDVAEHFNSPEMEHVGFKTDFLFDLEDPKSTDSHQLIIRLTTSSKQIEKTIPLQFSNDLAPISLDSSKIEKFDSKSSWDKGLSEIDKKIGECVDVEFYILRNPDVKTNVDEGKIHPITHYLKHGWKQRRDPSPLFSNIFYRKQFPELAPQDHPLKHYLTSGHAEAKNISTFFDSNWYKQAYDCKDVPPLLHYSRALKNGESVFPNSSREFGIAQFPQLFKSYSDALTYFPSDNVQTRFFNFLPIEFMDFTSYNYDKDYSHLKGNEIGFHVNRRFQTVNIPIVVFGTNKIGHEDEFINKYVDWLSLITTGDIFFIELGEGIITPTNNIHLVSNLEEVNQKLVEKGSDTFVGFLNYGIIPSLNAWSLIGSDLKADNDIVGCNILEYNYRLSSAGIEFKNGKLNLRGHLQALTNPKYYTRERNVICDPRMFAIKLNHIKSFVSENDQETYEGLDTICQLLVKTYQTENIRPVKQGTVFGRDVSILNAVGKFSWLEHFNNLSSLELPVDKRVLLIESKWIMTDNDAGSVYSDHLINMLLDEGYVVDFFSTSEFYYHLKYAPFLAMKGVRCYYKPFYNSVKEIKFDQNPDIVFLHSFHVANYLYYQLRNFFSKSKFVFNTIDLHGWRLLREAKLNGSQKDVNIAHRTAQLEINLIKQCDATIILSESEFQDLNMRLPYPNIHLVPIPVDFLAQKTSNLSNRTDICFIGGFKHHPNVDAVDYFITQVWKEVKSKIPDAKFRIVGNHLPPALQEKITDDVIYEGFVEDLDAYLDDIRLTVAPLRVGAGVKGKILTSLANSVPCVTTDIGAEGMGLSDGSDIIIANDPKAISDAIVELYTDDNKWNEISENGYQYVNSKFSYENVKIKFMNMIDSLKK